MGWRAISGDIEMSIKRLTKEDIARTTGILNPIGHVILAFKDDAVTANAVAAMRATGFPAEDTLVYLASEATPRLRQRVESVSQAAGFGYEITLMRRYLALAEQGCGWIIVFALGNAEVERLTEVATRFGALCAVRYHRLANEDLI
jgi:hypothetical protein